MKLNKTSSKHSLLKQRQRISAFTLIELLVVIAIIAILASIALPAFSLVQERGKQTKDMSNGKQIALALKQFATDHDGVFPNKQPAADYATATDLLAATFLMMRCGGSFRITSPARMFFLYQVQLGVPIRRITK